MKILAFPGMGKTPLAQKCGKFIDLDFGHFRSAFGVSKEKEASLISPFIKLMEEYEKEGYVVLSNDPKVLGQTSVDYVFVPSDPRRAAKKLDVDPAVVEEWIDDWIDTAMTKSDAVIIPLEVGLDHYFLKSKNRRKWGV